MIKQKAEIVRKGYNKIAQTYHEQRNRYNSATLLKKISKYVPNGSEILDLGCGAGIPVALFLSKKGYEVTGIDFSDSMLKLARKNVPHAKFIRIDITKMKFIENTFDGVVSFYAIIHIPREKHAKIYKDLHRIIRPNGIILINPTGSDNWEGYEENYLGVKMFWSHYGPEKTLVIIRKAGFEIIWSKLLRLGGEKQFWVLAQNKK